MGSNNFCFWQVQLLKVRELKRLYLLPACVALYDMPGYYTEGNVLFFKILRQLPDTVLLAKRPVDQVGPKFTGLDIAPDGAG